MTLEYQTASPPRQPISKLNICLWVLQVLIGLAFIMGGVTKLAGIRPAVEAFDKVGLGQWFRYVTGGLEVLGGILLLVPQLCGVGALLLCCIMVGAIITHLTRLGGSPLGAVIFLILCAVIAFFRRDRTARLLKA